MILKQLRIGRHLSQEQLATMAGLSVRTIQRIESGHNASVESLKSLASALEVDIATLNQETFSREDDKAGWQALPFWLKCWFFFHFLSVRTRRGSVKRIKSVSEGFGFAFCALGLLSEASLAGGLILLANGYLFQILLWQGDRYGIWYDAPKELT
jgi:transcriptional regulator with XRE-family HTH domain